MSEPDTDEFEKFVDLLLGSAPEGYTPWLFRCEKEGKAPATEFGSWKSEKNQLDRQEAIEAMEDGYNIGIAGMDDDRLVNVDIDDDDETDPSEMKDTLLARSRSRYGRHGFYFAEEGEEVPNIPTDDKGEVRSQGQYVLAPGSYVPTDTDEVPDGQEEYAGYYTVEEERPPAQLTVEELPDVFLAQLNQSQAQQELEEANEGGNIAVPNFDGKSAVFDVSAQDVAAIEGASTDPSDRWESAFHGSTTGHNMSLSQKGRIQCWRHNVAHGGLQALVTLSDHPGSCEAIGTEHKGSNAGPSSIKGDDSAIWHAWKYAKQNGYIPEDDPIPYRALKHLCRERELCPPSEIPDGYDPEAGETLPDYAYDAAISSVENYDGLQSGRESTQEIEEDVEGESEPADEPEQVAESNATRWPTVHGLYGSDTSGSTTKANTIAADLIDQEYEIVPIRDTGVVYFYDYDKGYYVRKGERYLEQIIQDKLGEKWNINRARNVRKNVIARNWVSQDEFTPPRGKVCVKNGVLDLENRELEQHSPDYYFTSQLDVAYDSDAKTDKWQEFLADVVPDPGEAKKIEEFIGYTLQVWHHKRHKNLFIVGPTQSGKSTLADVIKTMYGSPPTVVNLTPQQIADTRFDAAALEDAMLNTVNDINATKIENSGALKRVFAGEPLKLENKHKDASFGAPKCKHLFTANWLPPIVGQDEAVWRRLLIVEFPDTVPNDKRDEDLPEKLKDELPGILNRALDGLDRLKEQNGFTNDKSRSQTQTLWDSWRDAHKRFLYQTFEITGDSDDSVQKDTYYQAYKEYASEHGFEIKPKQSVTKSLKYIAEIEANDDYYAGIDWKEKRGESSSQDRLNTQANLRSTVLEWVNEFETPLSGADKQQIRQYAKQQEADVERVGNVIDNLLTDGTIYESGDGVRLNKRS